MSRGSRVLGGRLAAARLRGEAGLFVAADAAVRVQAFQDELGRAGAHGVRLARAQAQLLGLFHQTLNLSQLSPTIFAEVRRLVQLQRSAQLEPLDHVC